MTDDMTTIDRLDPWDVMSANSRQLRRFRAELEKHMSEDNARAIAAWAVCHGWGDVRCKVRHEMPVGTDNGVAWVWVGDPTDPSKSIDWDVVCAWDRQGNPPRPKPVNGMKICELDSILPRREVDIVARLANARGWQYLWLSYPGADGRWVITGDDGDPWAAITESEVARGVLKQMA